MSFSGRIELIQADESWTRLKVGDRGTVVAIDEDGTVHVEWDDPEESEGGALDEGVNRSAQ